MSLNNHGEIKQKMIITPHTKLAWLKVMAGSLLDGIGANKLALRLAMSARNDCTIELK